jgi:hypothetical protein
VVVEVAPYADRQMMFSDLVGGRWSAPLVERSDPANEAADHGQRGLEVR